MRSKPLFLGVLVGVGLLAAYWFLLLAPKRDEVAVLKGQVTEKQQEVTAAEGTLATYRTARDGYEETYARVTRLGKAVPADDDVRSLVVQLDGAAKGSKVNFKSIAVAGATGPSTAPASGAPAVTPPPGAISSGSAGFSTMPFTLEFSGNYSRLSDLFTQLERFVSVKRDEVAVTGRLMRVDSIVLTPTAGALPNTLQASVTASTFLVPPTAGVAGAETPQATAAPTTTASATGGGSTVPTPTAAATGAIE